MKVRCEVCGDPEPTHVHNGGKRIDDYFCVGRGETDFDAAERWKARALAAESKTPGFMVFNEHFGCPYALLTRANDAWDKVPKSGVLLHEATRATVFRNRKEANQAIDRTLRYHAKHGTADQWKDTPRSERFCIVSLQPAS